MLQPQPGKDQCPEALVGRWSFKTLQTASGIQSLDADWLADLCRKNPELHARVIAYRAGSGPNRPEDLSTFLIALSQTFEAFLLDGFEIASAHAAIKARIEKDSPILLFKKACVKKALKKPSEDDGSLADSQAWLLGALSQAAFASEDREWAVAALFAQWQRRLPDDEAQVCIDRLQAWCRLVVSDAQGRKEIEGWGSFALPERLDFMHLVACDAMPEDLFGRRQGQVKHFRERDGFALTDVRMSERQSLLEADYCVDCHEQAGDFCSTGFPIKKKNPELGFKSDPLGEILTGCPVEEKISEMHWLYKRGHVLAALAMIMRDNPLCALTGHRICNECMKACIYQKQTPVNIPQVETNILTQVLHLPWGVELYDLLMRWNPLRQTQWCEALDLAKRVLIMGMGPAGISLSHHLLMAGHTVVGMDGLKIEPLPQTWLNNPIRDFRSVSNALDERVVGGFGGVSEYGITVRWDKNFLTLVHIVMCRRQRFRVYGGMRFGGAICIEDAWRLGFDHLAIAVGAGLPKALPLSGGLAPGVRQANDFLMALQLTGATKQDSLVDLEVHLPAVVIGGGLTGVDTATELQAYYIRQVERILDRYEALSKVLSKADCDKAFGQLHPGHLNRFLQHGQLVREARLRAKNQGAVPNFIALIREWGGVSIVYRKCMAESPAYKRNHEELAKALEEGVCYADNLEPIEILLDDHGHCKALRCLKRVQDESGQWVSSGEGQILPASSILVATGAQTNVAYAFEHRDDLERKGFAYQSYDLPGKQSEDLADSHCKTKQVAAFTSYTKQGYRVSFLGDTHPVFHGNVIKAIASGQHVYPEILALLAKSACQKESSHAFLNRLDADFEVRVIDHEVIGDALCRLVLRAPWLAKQHRLGQFYRLQNFEREAIALHGKSYQMAALSLMPTEVSRDSGLIAFAIPLADSASHMLCRYLQVGMRMSLMGPTGNKHHPTQNANTVFVGNHIAQTQLLSFGDALRAQGNRLCLVATAMPYGMIDPDRIHKLAELIILMPQAEADLKTWQEATGVDTVTQGGLGDAIYTRKANWEAVWQCLDEQFAAGGVSRVYVGGEPDLIRELQRWRRMLTSHRLTPKTITEKSEWIAHVQAPMQCMLKGVCAQCQLWQQDPETGMRSKSVYACSWHQQPMAMVDPEGLLERQAQSATTSLLNSLWLKHVVIPRKKGVTPQKLGEL